MDEIEYADLEQRLRRSVVGHIPDAPESLIGFIETVPVRHRPASRIVLAFDRPRVRRSVFAMAAAAAVVVAVVGGAAFVSFRQVPVAATEPANVSDGWQWQATDGTLYLAAMAVPRGFVATCGHMLGQEIVDQSVCSSPDGLHWSAPADPAIVSVEGSGTFLPKNILVRKGTYMAVSRHGSGQFKGPALTLWRSTDGVHWSAVELPASLGLTTIDLVQLVPDGFLGVGTKNDPGIPPTQEMVISADGLNWRKASDMPYGSPVVGASYYRSPTIAAGFLVGGPRPGGTDVGIWRTTDGTTWEDVTMPAGFNQLSMVATLPDGSLRAVASSFDGSTRNAIVSSTDGLAWQLDPAAPAGSVDVLAVVGDRMVASVSAVAYTDPHAIWQSDDWGKSWRPLLDLAGQPVSGSVGTLGGRLEIRGTDGIAHWLLTPVTADPAAGPVESSSSPAPASPAESETSGPSTVPPAATPTDSAVPSAEPPTQTPAGVPSGTPASSGPAPTPSPVATAA